MKDSSKTKTIIVLAASLTLLSTTAQANIFITAANAVMSWVTWALMSVLMVFIYALMWAIKLNPQVYCSPAEVDKGCVATAGIDKLIPYFLDLLVPLYVVAFLFTAAYFIVKSTNPRGRARAKMMLFKLLYSMLLIAFAPLILQLLLDFESLITEMILADISWDDIEMVQSNWNAASTGAICCVIFIIYKLWWIAVAVVVLRYLIVVLFSVMFPIFLFLYFFDLTRGWGRKYIKRALTWIFTPVVQAMFLVLTVRSIQNMSGIFAGVSGEFAFLSNFLSIVSALFGILLVGACMLLFLVAPLIMSKLLQYIGAGLTSWGIATQNVPVAMLGGILEDRGPSAITQASGIGTRSGYYGYARGIIEGGVGGQTGHGMGGAPTGGKVFGATGEAPGGGAAVGGEGRRAGAESAKDAAGRDAEAATKTPTGPTRGRVGKTFKDASPPPTVEQKLLDQQGDGAAGPTVEADVHVSRSVAPPPGTTFTTRAPRAVSPKPPSRAPAPPLGPEPSAAEARAMDEKDAAAAADELAAGKSIDEQELRKLNAYVEGELARTQATAEKNQLESIMKGLKETAREKRTQRLLKGEEAKQYQLRGRIANVKLGKYLKRYMKQKSKKNVK